MRVVGGSAKGVRLAPVPRGVRPVSDMAREGVFSSLGDRVAGVRVLDLFAGTGAMAIEALSRGAEHAVLVERARPAVRAIRENLRRTRLERAADVVVADARSFLTKDDNRTTPFGLVLLDPPYEAPDDVVRDTLEALAAGWVAGHSWRAVLTRPKTASTPVIPVHWVAARRLGYGDTLVLIFQEA